jgi:hypothetical protein
MKRIYITEAVDSMKPRGFVHLVVLITITAIALGVLVAVSLGVIEQKKYEQRSAAASPTQLDTSTWKTYRNEQYGFEFIYPISWKIIEEKNVISLVEVNKEPSEIDPWINKIEFYKDGPRIDGGTRIIFLGHKATTTGWEEPEFGIDFEKVIVVDDPSLSIIMEATEPKFKTAMDGILSTLKFIPK